MVSESPTAKGLSSAIEIEANVCGPALVAQRIMRRAVRQSAARQLCAGLAEAGQGARVANITSQLGSIASTTRFGTPSYDISKAAQNMATALLAAVSLLAMGITYAVGSVVGTLSS